MLGQWLGLKAMRSLVLRYLWCQTRSYHKKAVMHIVQNKRSISTTTCSLPRHSYHIFTQACSSGLPNMFKRHKTSRASPHALCAARGHIPIEPAVTMCLVLKRPAVENFRPRPKHWIANRQNKSAYFLSIYRGHASIFWYTGWHWWFSWISCISFYRIYWEYLVLLKLRWISKHI